MTTNYETDDEYEYEEEEYIFHPTDGKYIKDAVSGVETRYLVGSKFETLFWKVSDVSLTSYDPSTQTGKTFFYSSPEAYEKNHNITLNETKKITRRFKKMTF